MSKVVDFACHYAFIRGYLLGRDAPSDVLASLDALHLGAVQKPVQDDALEVIRRVGEAAEKLMIRIDSLPEAARPVERVIISGPAENEPPPISERAMEAAEVKPEQEDESDESKIAAFLILL